MLSQGIWVLVSKNSRNYMRKKLLDATGTIGTVDGDYTEAVKVFTQPIHSLILQLNKRLA